MTILLSVEPEGARARAEESIRRAKDTLEADGTLVAELEGYGPGETPAVLQKALADFFAAKVAERLVGAGAEPSRVRVCSATERTGDHEKVGPSPGAPLGPRVVASFQRPASVAGTKESRPSLGLFDELGDLTHAERVRRVARFLAKGEVFLSPSLTEADPKVLDAWAYLHGAIRKAEKPGTTGFVSAAALLRGLEATILRLEKKQAEALEKALGTWSFGPPCEELDLSTMVCRDACKLLDLTRPGIEVPVGHEFLCTRTAARADVVDWVRRMNHGEFDDPPVDPKKAKRVRARWTNSG